MIENDSTVYIVDDDEGARKSVRALVRSMGIQGETFDSAEAFLANYEPDRTGCLVTDLRMMGMSGIELQERLAKAGCRLPVIIITAHAETPITVRAVKRGAVTVLEKPCRDYELLDAIRHALEQAQQDRADRFERIEFQQRLNTLSEQEKEVLELILDGIPNKAIANKLDVSIRTVENRRQRIFEKTDARSLAELVRLVVQSQELLDRQLELD